MSKGLSGESEQASLGGRTGSLGRCPRLLFIIAIVASCSVATGQSEQDTEEGATGDAGDQPSYTQEDLPPAPPVELLPQTFTDEFAKEGFENIEFIIVADSERGLVAYKAAGIETLDPPFPVDDFKIPGAGTIFRDAIVTYTESPARLVSCGMPAGGRRYCTITAR